MKKINVGLYGGKGILGGKETPLTAKIIYCDKCESCDLYKENKCLNVTAPFSASCKYGKVESIKGYTSRAMKYHEFREKYKTDEYYSKLNYPNDFSFVEIGDYYVVNIAYTRIRWDEGKGPYRYIAGWDIDVPFMGTSVSFIPKDDFTLEYDNRNGVNKVKLSGRSDLKMSFYTVHKSKGLQADYVFIINNRNTYMGFPSKVQNPDIIERLLERMDDYPDSEERRLFYVALTRARRKVFIVSADNKQSSFACEMISKYGAEMKKEVWTCPICGGSLRKVKGPYGEFYGCSNYPKCKYTSNKRKY